ncbi:General negative regulator of transcription subunit 2 [Fusarium oxysporum f. sp. albedinis]|nr:General negative regulator of transcription subunit 2 [Fusarium oxysporum f. sp. albedinis]
MDRDLRLRAEILWLKGGVQRRNFSSSNKSSISVGQPPRWAFPFLSSSSPIEQTPQVRYQAKRERSILATSTFIVDSIPNDHSRMRLLKIQCSQASDIVEVFMRQSVVVRSED